MGINDDQRNNAGTPVGAAPVSGGGHDVRVIKPEGSHVRVSPGHPPVNPNHPPGAHIPIAQPLHPTTAATAAGPSAATLAMEAQEIHDQGFISHDVAPHAEQGDGSSAQRLSLFAGLTGLGIMGLYALLVIGALLNAG